ncbi:MAG: hypothetical protein O2954_13140 [bacterium]|nr:hypothetical protein [bacterium]
MDAEVKAEGEVNEGFNRLVAEIDRAVNLIERLRREKDSLEQTNRELQNRLEQQEQALSEIRTDRDRLEKLYQENASLIDNKEDIQRKIEAMLSRLDTVNVP